MYNYKLRIVLKVLVSIFVGKIKLVQKDFSRMPVEILFFILSTSPKTMSIATNNCYNHQLKHALLPSGLTLAKCKNPGALILTSIRFTTTTQKLKRLPFLLLELPTCVYVRPSGYSKSLAIKFEMAVLKTPWNFSYSGRVGGVTF